jgi:hypothetical protein
MTGPTYLVLGYRGPRKIRVLTTRIPELEVFVSSR